MALAADTGSKSCPNLPTMKESGYPARSVLLVRPGGARRHSAGGPAKLEKALADTLAMPDVRKRLTDMGAIVQPLNGKQFGDYIECRTRQVGRPSSKRPAYSRTRPTGLRIVGDSAGRVLAAGVNLGIPRLRTPCNRAGLLSISVMVERAPIHGRRANPNGSACRSSSSRTPTIRRPIPNCSKACWRAAWSPS